MMMMLWLFLLCIAAALGFADAALANAKLKVNNNVELHGRMATSWGSSKPIDQAPLLLAPSVDPLLCFNQTSSSIYKDVVILVPRGNCTFEQKALAAKTLGSIGIVVYNNLESRYGWNGTAVRYPRDQWDYECDNGISLLGELPPLDPPQYNGSTFDKYLTANSPDNVCQAADDSDKCNSGRCLVTDPTQEAACCAWDLHITMGLDRNLQERVNSIFAVFVTMRQGQQLMDIVEDEATTVISLSERNSPAFNVSLLLLWLWGIFVTGLASWLSAGEYRKTYGALVRYMQQRSGSTSIPLNDDATVTMEQDELDDLALQDEDDDKDDDEEQPATLELVQIESARDELQGLDQPVDSVQQDAGPQEELSASPQLPRSLDQPQEAQGLEQLESQQQQQAGLEALQGFDHPVNKVQQPDQEDEEARSSLTPAITPLEQPEPRQAQGVDQLESQQAREASQPRQTSQAQQSSQEQAQPTQQQQQTRPRRGPQQQQPQHLELTVWHAVVFVVAASTILLLLFYFKFYGVITVLYGVGCSAAMAQVLFRPLYMQLAKKVPQFRWFQCSIRYVSWLDVACIASAYSVGVPWIVFAFTWTDPMTNAFFWITQNIMGACLCILFLTVVRLSSIKVATALLLCAFIYDIFFVFLSPHIFNGESVMVEVATAGGPVETRDENWCEKYPRDWDCRGGDVLPMVFAIPKVNDYRGGVSLLGLGDIILPGLLIAFAARLDQAKRLSKLVGISTLSCSYFLPLLLSYALGLLAAYLAVYFMQKGQPALLYIVPANLIAIYAVGRNELRSLWKGPKEIGYADNLIKYCHQHNLYDETTGSASLSSTRSLA